MFLRESFVLKSRVPGALGTTLRKQLGRGEQSGRLHVLCQQRSRRFNGASSGQVSRGKHHSKESYIPNLIKNACREKKNHAAPLVTLGRPHQAVIYRTLHRQPHTNSGKDSIDSWQVCYRPIWRLRIRLGRTRGPTLRSAPWPRPAMAAPEPGGQQPPGQFLSTIASGGCRRVPSSLLWIEA